MTRVEDSKGNVTATYLDEGGSILGTQDINYDALPAGIQRSLGIHGLRMRLLGTQSPKAGKKLADALAQGEFSLRATGKRPVTYPVAVQAFQRLAKTLGKEMPLREASQKWAALGHARRLQVKRTSAFQRELATVKAELAAKTSDQAPSEVLKDLGL